LRACGLDKAPQYPRNAAAGQPVPGVSGFCDHPGMKKIVLYVPIVFSLLLLGAHFLRYGNTLIVLGVVALLALLFVRRWWVARFMQFVLAAGALVWLWTLVLLVQERMALGAPYLRLAVILSAVAAVTVLAALLFQSRELKDIYQAPSNS
jgi:hypothetical protein